jgi:Gas vesicle protein
MGSLLPKSGGYYPGETSASPSILELLDRLLHTGVVLEGSVDLGLAQLSLIHAKLQLVLTSQPIAANRNNDRTNDRCTPHYHSPTIPSKH